MEREKTVVDASVILKWFLQEKGGEAALALREDHITSKRLLIVPELLFVEVLNVLLFKGMTKKEMSLVHQALWDTHFQIERINHFLLEKANELALQYKLSLYDALYLAVSIVHGSPFITADHDFPKIPQVIFI